MKKLDQPAVGEPYFFFRSGFSDTEFLVIGHTMEYSGGSIVEYKS